jgi:hypothetical protein
VSIDATTAMRGTFAQDSPAVRALFDALVELFSRPPATGQFIHRRGIVSRTPTYGDGLPHYLPRRFPCPSLSLIAASS